VSLRVGSLFSGVEGFGLAAERVGMTLAWSAEIEPFACTVLAHRFPVVPNLGDVTRITDAPHVDVITFGSPCQDLSAAGKRAGMAGERSGLFFEAIRIIERVRPEFAVWENVPGALSSYSGRDFARCLDALANVGALDIAWRVLDAQNWGVPQRRRRVFVVCDFAGERAAEILALTEGGAGHPPTRRAQGQDLAYALAASVRGTGDGHGNARNTTYALQGNMIGREDKNGPAGVGWTADTMFTLNTVDVHAVAPCVTRRYGKGADSDAGDALIFNQQNSAVVDTVGTLQAEGMARQNRGFLIADLAQITSKANRTRVEAGQPASTPAAESQMIVATADPLPSVIEQLIGQPGGGVWPCPSCHLAIRVEVVACPRCGAALPYTPATHPLADVANALTASNGHHGHSSPRGDGSDNLVAYAVSENQRAETRLADQTYALTGGGGKPGQGYPAALQGGGVRRLTPVECERLQGFPDGWTCLHDHAQPCDCPDGPRYRAMGNAVCVNVAHWLLGRIARLETP
jgi:DNA (cytosine-5)-methyltransferase 1